MFPSPMLLFTFFHLHLFQTLGKFEGKLKIVSIGINYGIGTQIRVIRLLNVIIRIVDHSSNVYLGEYIFEGLYGDTG